jgi:hypothetical protein
MRIVTRLRLTRLLLNRTDHWEGSRKEYLSAIGFQGMPIDSSMKQRYENDDRLYSRSNAHPRSRYFVQCLAEQAH